MHLSSTSAGWLGENRIGLGGELVHTGEDGQQPRSAGGRRAAVPAAIRQSQ